MTYYERNGQTRKETYRTLWIIVTNYLVAYARAIWRGRELVLLGVVYAAFFFMVGRWSA